MPIDPKLLEIRSLPLAVAEQAKSYVNKANPGGGAKASAYIDEVYRLYNETGYSPEVLVAQWDLETGSGTSTHWVNRNNPGGIGVTDGKDFQYSWKTPEAAAQAQSVHLSAYVDGYNRNLRRYLDLDPRYLLVLKTDWAESVKVVDDLTGKWATDPLYGKKIADRLERIRNTVVVTPGQPQPTPGGIDAPPLVWLGTGNYHNRPLGSKMIVAVTHHITDDMVFDHVHGWFQNPTSQASSHFVVDRDGTIYQFVSTLNASWTNGDYNRPRTDIPALNKAIKEVQTYGYNLNDYTISIEYVGTPETPPTNAQYESGISIVRYCISRYPSISPNRGGQWRHADINSVSRPYCPGPKFDLERIIRAVGGDPRRMT